MDEHIIEAETESTIGAEAACPPAKEESELDQILAKAVRHIKAKRGGDLAAIILAGSAARDAMTPHSDVDFLVLVLGQDNSYEVVRFMDRIVEIRYLGKAVAEEQLQTSPRLPIILRKTRILYELDAAGTQLLHKAHARFRQGPPPPSINEKIRLRAETLHWLGKTEDHQRDPATARYLLSIYLDECMGAFYRLRGFWPSSPVEHFRFIAQRDRAFGDLLQQAFASTELSEQLATARRIADYLFKDVPAPARID